MKATEKITGISIKNNRKVKVFLFFLILTSIIWLLIELSKSSISTVVFKVSYKNIPVGKLIQNEPISEFKVALKAPGFTLLKYKIKKYEVALNLNNVTKKGSVYYLLPNKQLSLINSKLSGETEVVRILKDTIFVELGNNISKKVPVVSAIKMQYKLGYNLTEKLKISPDSVLVTGPEKYIDSIKELKTKLLELKNIYENVDIDIALESPIKNTNVVFSVNKVNIKGKVDKFTEGSFFIPVKIINEPKGVTINPFPKEIEVVYKAGLSDFNKITKNSFSIVFDYKQYENDTVIRYLTPIIKQKSDYISSLKINPNQIEFLIQK